MQTDVSRYEFEAPDSRHRGRPLIFRRAFQELAEQKGWDDPDNLMERHHRDRRRQKRISQARAEEWWGYNAGRHGSRPSASGSSAVQFKWDRYDEMTGEDYILEVKNLKQHFPIYRGFFSAQSDTPRP